VEVVLTGHHRFEQLLVAGRERAELGARLALDHSATTQLVEFAFDLEDGEVDPVF
jgi:hypothetical protein